MTEHVHRWSAGQMSPKAYKKEWRLRCECGIEPPSLDEIILRLNAAERLSAEDAREASMTCMMSHGEIDADRLNAYAAVLEGEDGAK